MTTNDLPPAEESHPHAMEMYKEALRQKLRDGVRQMWPRLSPSDYQAHFKGFDIEDLPRLQKYLASIRERLEYRAQNPLPAQPPPEPKSSPPPAKTSRLGRIWKWLLSS